MPYKDPEKAKAAKKKWDQEHRNGKRHQVWIAIFYPEDNPNWEQELCELCVPTLVSPLHDKDVWTALDERRNPEHKEGALKKPHRHIVAEYPGVVSYEDFKSDFDFLGGEGGGLHAIKFARSKSASTLYLAHETAECKKQGKHPYDPAEVLEFCGANYLDWRTPLDDLHGQMKAMRAFIREWNITEFNDFVDWCDENNEDWARLLDVKCAWAIGNYIDRQRNKQAAMARLERERRRDNEGDGDAAEV